MFLGDDFIITVRHGEASRCTRCARRSEADPELLRRGPGAVLHAILDRVVDDYQPAIEGLEKDIDEVEEELFSGERTNPAERIYRLQREVLQFRKATAPLVDPVDRLAGGQYVQIHPEIRDYFRDVNDHLIRAREQLDAMRDLLAGSLQANLAQVARAPERGHAPDLGLGRDHRGADRDRRHLRHELRAHARAASGSSATRPRCC